MTNYQATNVALYVAGGSGDNLIPDGYVKAVEKIWLDWKNQGLIEPKWHPMGVDQAVVRILTETK